MIDVLIIEGVLKETTQKKRELESRLSETLIMMPELERQVRVGQEAWEELCKLRTTVKKLTREYSALV